MLTDLVTFHDWLRGWFALNLTENYFELSCQAFSFNEFLMLPNFTLNYVQYFDIVISGRKKQICYLRYFANFPCTVNVIFSCFMYPLACGLLHFHCFSLLAVKFTFKSAWEFVFMQSWSDFPTEIFYTSIVLEPFRSSTPIRVLAGLARRPCI